MAQYSTYCSPGKKNSNHDQHFDDGHDDGAAAKPATTTTDLDSHAHHSDTFCEAAIIESDGNWNAFHPDDDLIRDSQGDEATAYLLKDLASMVEPSHPSGEVVIDDPMPMQAQLSSKPEQLSNDEVELPQKREREDDENDSKPQAKRSHCSLEARRIMRDVEMRRSSARQALEAARAQLKCSQEHFQQMTKELEQAEHAVSETSQQLCDELLQEETSWNAMYKVLMEFHEAHGHTRVPRNPSKEQKEADPNLSKLGGWVGRQRRAYRRPRDNDQGTLEAYQMIALERLNFDFDPHKTVWMKRYSEVKAFKETHGHFDVPLKKAVLEKSSSDDSESTTWSLDDSATTTATSDGSESNGYSALASWVKRQQYQYKLFRDGNTASEMTDERIALLEEIGFPWSKRAEHWMERYNALKDYKQKNGHTRPPNTKDFRALSEWAKDQRRQFKRYEEAPSKSNLSQKQMALLKELPLDLDLRAASWSAQLQQLMNFKEQHGHCVLPSKYPLNPKLASWVATQRRQYQLKMDGKPSQLTDERIKILTEADFEWKVTSERREQTSNAMVKTWDELYAEILDRHVETGTLDVGKRHDLRVWLNSQRQQYQLLKAGRTSELTSNQVDKLLALGIDEPVVTERQKAAEYTMQPQKVVASEAKRPATTRAAGITASHVKSWTEYYTELLTHRVTSNSFQVPTDHALYPWVQKQRMEYAKYVTGQPSMLTSEEISKLNSVGFRWHENESDGASSSLSLLGQLDNDQPLIQTKSWEEMFSELLAFRIRFQTFDIPSTNYELCAWMTAQRHMLSSHLQAVEISALAEERIHKLLQIGFPWEPTTTMAAANVNAPPLFEGAEAFDLLNE